MRTRCQNKKSASYAYYGARGIKVCKEWNESPKPFIDWCLSHGYKNGLQLHRIDNDGDYSPSNCKFVTSEENDSSKRNTRYLTINGITKTAAQWARKIGKSSDTVIRRYNSGCRDIGDFLKPRYQANITKGERFTVKEKLILAYHILFS